MAALFPLEHIQAFRLRASQMQNGADENLQPLFVRQVIAGTPMTWINAMCMTPEREFSIDVALFTGNAGADGVEIGSLRSQVRTQICELRSGAVLCPPQSLLFPPRDRGENCE